MATEKRLPFLVHPKQIFGSSNFVKALVAGWRQFYALK